VEKRLVFKNINKMGRGYLKAIASFKVLAIESKNIHGSGEFI